MSTVLRPEDLSFLCFYDEKRGDGDYGEPGEWYKISDLVQIDGVSVYQSRRPIEELWIGRNGEVLLVPTKSAPIFAFRRYMADLLSSDNTPIPLFTCYGYQLTEVMKVILLVGPGGVEYRVVESLAPLIA